MPHQYQAQLCSGPPGLDTGQRWRRVRGVSSRGPGRSPTCLSPGSSQRGGWATAWAEAGAPVAYPQAAALRATQMAPVCSERRFFGDLFREQERAGCLQELKLLCKEQRQRAEAGGDHAGACGDGGAAPTARLQSPPPGAEPNGEVAVQGPGCSSVRPGVHPSVHAGQCTGPEHPSQGR